MMERGLEFEPIDLYKSHPTRFLPTEKGVRIPLAALSGIGTSAALSIDEARSSGVPFISQEDLRVRSKVSKSVIEKLAACTFQSIKIGNRKTGRIRHLKRPAGKRPDRFVLKKPKNG